MFLLFEEDNNYNAAVGTFDFILGLSSVIRDDILFIHRPMKNVSKPLFKLRMSCTGKTTMNLIGSSKGWYSRNFSFISLSFLFFFLVK